MQREATLTARPSALAGTAMLSGILEGMSARMSSPVLVGRGDHMGALEAALDRARAGGPSAVLIGGRLGSVSPAW